MIRCVGAMRTAAAAAGLFALTGSAVLRAADAPLQLLTAEALVKEKEIFIWEGLSPSPDGQWLMFQVSDPTIKLRFEYALQRTTRSGYPLIAGTVGSQVWVTDIGTGKTFSLATGQGMSWSGSWSPDSRYLAFYSDRSGEAALWVMDRETGSQRQVSTESVRSGWWRQRPLWSADGKTLLCLLTPEGKTAEDMLKLSPSYPAPGLPGGAADDDKARVHVYSHDPLKESGQGAGAQTEAGPRDAFTKSASLADLAVIDVASGAVTRLAKGVMPFWFGYSPDKTRVVIENKEPSTAVTQAGAYSIKIYDTRDRSMRTLARGEYEPNILITRPSFSPDGDSLAYCDTSATLKLACYVIDLKTGKKIEATTKLADTPPDLRWGPPLWDPSGQWLFLQDTPAGRLWAVKADGKQAREVVTFPGARIKDLATNEMADVYWSADGGKTAYVRVQPNGSNRNALYSVNVHSGEAKKLFEDDAELSMGHMGAFTGVSHGGGTLIFSSQSISKPTDLWSLNLTDGQIKQLTQLNPEISAAAMGRVEVIEWLSSRGEQLRGSLLLPANYREGQRYPMMVWVYGGDKGSELGGRFGFGKGAAFNPQMWASRGYAVLYPDIPLHKGTPVDDVLSAVVPGVNKTVELGIVDPHRVAVSGSSFGMYNTLSLITHTKLFKAAIAANGAAANLYEGYTRFLNGLSNAAYYEEGQGGMRGSPWAFKEDYYDNSPMFFMDRVETPLLIQRGLMDPISVDNGAVFNALRSMNKRVEFLEYEYEGHGLQQAANVIDFWNRRIAWLDQYLR